MWLGYMDRWGFRGRPTHKTNRPTDLTVRERVYGKKEERKMGEKILVPVCVWHNIIIVLGESMSRRGEMGFLKDEFDIIFLRAGWLFNYVSYSTKPR